MQEEQDPESDGRDFTRVPARMERDYETIWAIRQVFTHILLEVLKDTAVFLRKNVLEDVR